MIPLIRQLNATITSPHDGSAISEPTLSLSAAHLSEVDAIQLADAAVRAAFELLVSRIRAIGDTLPGDRYGELIEHARDGFEDGMPAGREHGDDAFDDGDA